MDLDMNLEDSILGTPYSQIQESPAPPNTPLTFVTLPQEIRNRIYEYATVFPETTELDEINKKLRRDLYAFEDSKAFLANCIRRPVKPFAILAAVNKQIRGEIMHFGLGAYKARELESGAMLREAKRVISESKLLKLYWLEIHRIM